MANWNDDRLDKRDEEVKAGFVRLEEQIKAGFAESNKRSAKTDERFEKTDERLAQMATRQEMNERFAKVDERFAEMRSEMQKGFAEMRSAYTGLTRTLLTAAVAIVIALIGFHG